MLCSKYMLGIVGEGCHYLIKQDPSVKLKLTVEEIKCDLYLYHYVGLKTILI